MTEGSAKRPRLGKYELRGELGRGAMGVVYRAFDHVLEREVALKTMAAPDADKVEKVRFLREARTAGSLHHPNIVTIHELGHADGTHFISMEMLVGRTLQHVIKSGKLPPISKRLDTVARFCDGLDYAHRASIVHRDIKPANIFLLENGTVKILDFGIAKIAQSDQTRTGLLIGTVDYMSPEQVRAVKNLDGRSDIFSAGVILYELLFRRRPFTADDLGATLHRILHSQPPGWAMFERSLPVELSQVLRRSLDKRREARYARASEMAEALDRAATMLADRAGLELEQRIDELISAGALEHKDSELPATTGVSSSDTVGGVTAAQAPTLASDTAVPKPRRGKLWLLGGLGTAAVLSVALLQGVGRKSEPSEPVRVARTDTGPALLTNVPEDEGPLEEIEPTSTDPADKEDPVPVEQGAEQPQDDPKPTPMTRPVQQPAPPKPVAPPPKGTLNVLVMPWANIDWIENLDTGERLPSGASTPARLELPEGRYRLRLVNPYAERQLDLEAVVEGRKTSVVRRAMPGFDAAELAKEIVIREQQERSSRQ